jgi:hypothetical protein
LYTLVRRFIKTGLGFLGVGLILGLVMLYRREVNGVFAGPYMRSAHTHAILVGFVMFLILGVALWLFPRAEKGDTRYDPRLMAAVYWVLAVATAARVGGEAVRSFVVWPWLRWVIFAAGTAQVLAILTYFWGMWTRIRPVGSHIREARGERF